MKAMRRGACGLLALVLALLLTTVAGAAGGERTVTVLFTHDLHSHFLPQREADGGESGGYARLKTALDLERAAYPGALVVDGGDFSSGSLIQTLFTTQAAELRTMEALGYDAAAIGNHEFDHQGTGFGEMLNAAVLSGDKTPDLLCANYRPAADNPDQLDIQRAMATYGVKESMVLERGGITFGIFGLMGVESDAYAPVSGFTLEDPVEAAKRCVAQLREQGAEVIVCLSHSGTNENWKKSEDEQLAKKVEGIDIIVSGHSHTTLEQPIQVGDTYVVSAGPYCENLGSITLTLGEDGSRTLGDYRLIPIDETLPEDEEIAALIEGWKSQVGSVYLGRYGLGCDQVLTASGFDLPKPESGKQEGNALGELVSDAFVWAARELAADAPRVDTVGITADGVIRAPLYAGALTTAQAFDVLSIGMGEDGTSGYPLVEAYLTGKELKAAAEVDASVTPIMPEAQLYMSGLTYSFNTNRMFFNRVTDCKLLVDGQPVKLENDKLYRVVANLYSAQMLGTVTDKTFGLLSLVPKDAQGQPITDFSRHILRDKNGNEIKEWYALADYLRTFGSEGLPGRYAQPDGRKEVSGSWNPIQLLKNPNWITLVLLAVVLLVVLLVVWLVRRLRGRRRGSRSYGGRRRGYGGRRRRPFGR